MCSILSGQCEEDGMYYHADTSFVYCVGGHPIIQQCPPGTRNPSYEKYMTAREEQRSLLCTTSNDHSSSSSSENNNESPSSSHQPLRHFEKHGGDSERRQEEDGERRQERGRYESGSSSHQELPERRIDSASVRRLPYQRRHFEDVNSREEKAFAPSRGGARESLSDAWALPEAVHPFPSQRLQPSNGDQQQRPSGFGGLPLSRPAGYNEGPNGDNHRFGFERGQDHDLRGDTGRKNFKVIDDILVTSGTWPSSPQRPGVQPPEAQQEQQQQTSESFPSNNGPAGHRNQQLNNHEQQQGPEFEQQHQDSAPFLSHEGQQDQQNRGQIQHGPPQKHHESASFQPNRGIQHQFGQNHQHQQRLQGQQFNPLPSSPSLQLNRRPSSPSFASRYQSAEREDDRSESRQQENEQLQEHENLLHQHTYQHTLQQHQQMQLKHQQEQLQHQQKQLQLLQQKHEKQQQLHLQQQQKHLHQQQQMLNRLQHHGGSGEEMISHDSSFENREASSSENRDAEVEERSQHEAHVPSKQPISEHVHYGQPISEEKTRSHELDDDRWSEPVNPRSYWHSQPYYFPSPFPYQPYPYEP